MANVPVALPLLPASELESLSSIICIALPFPSLHAVTKDHHKVTSVWPTTKTGTACCKK